MRCRITRQLGLAAIALALSLGAGITPAPAPALAQERAVAPEVNPPGDIPDNQQFVTFDAPQGAALQVPEGWARTDATDGAVFADKYDRIELSIQPMTAPLSLAAIRSSEAAKLERSGRAVKIAKIEPVALPAGPAVRVVYTSNSEANPVTNKQVRLESERFYLEHAGKLAALTLSAPAGADNADQWALISKSFRWK